MYLWIYSLILKWHLFVDIINMIQALDNHILLSQLCLWKDKSNLSKMSKFKILSWDLSVATVELKKQLLSG